MVGKNDEYGMMNAAIVPCTSVRWAGIGSKLPMHHRLADHGSVMHPSACFIGL